MWPLRPHAVRGRADSEKARNDGTGRRTRAPGAPAAGRGAFRVTRHPTVREPTDRESTTELRRFSSKCGSDVECHAHVTIM